MNTTALVVVIVVVALGFDYTNGFHDSANAIATSISTKALTPRVALAMAAVMNVVGALISTKVATTVGSGIIDAADARPQPAWWSCSPRCSARSSGTSAPGTSGCPRPRRTR